MRFSIDAHAIGRNLTGNEVYIRNLIHGFVTLDDESEFIAYVSEADAQRSLPPGFRSRRVARNPFVRLGWDLTRCVRADRPNLLHVQYTAPLNCPANIVVSVHDVSFVEHPEYFPPARAFQLRTTVERTVRRASRVLTPSDYSARAIRRAYNLPDEQVVVTPNGVSSQFRPLPRERALPVVRERFGIPGPYIFTVGDLQPRKNQVGLIDAFERLIETTPMLPHHLVLAGQDSWYGGQVKGKAARSRYRDRIHFTGFVTDEELLQLYIGCDVFAFPSLYEGFGLPILEAMACGRAVVCSSTTACGEVADSAALLFDPRDKVDMMQALRDLLVDPELRARIERLGIARAGQFQWRNAARGTLDVYYEVAGRTPERSGARARTAAVRP
jgi:glycosyltransferase involved in cell wall biosynthesis